MKGVEIHIPTFKIDDNYYLHINNHLRICIKDDCYCFITEKNSKIIYINDFIFIETTVNVEHKIFVLQVTSRTFNTIYVKLIINMILNDGKET